MSARERLLKRLRQAFLDHGYEQISMSALAELCGLTRRALYHHFSNKEEAFRFVLRFDNETAIRQGVAAGRVLIEKGATPVDILTEIMDVRYGENRRRLAASPHALEINDQAFRRARDLMIEAAVVFQSQLAEILAELDASGVIRLGSRVGPEALAQLLCDGARGSNQALPPIPLEQLRPRYAAVIEAILFGSLAKG
ncbi:TetR/AcrR family transcriptional regulator [Paradevosia shaoguanensis]|uniref:TetR/AcrR family transcriptional regulator n=1 Tax=Paradevosia shaoguanensis TaxID=1335043 RepID=UPI003C706AD2